MIETLNGGCVSLGFRGIELPYRRHVKQAKGEKLKQRTETKEAAFVDAFCVRFVWAFPT